MRKSAAPSLKSFNNQTKNSNINLDSVKSSSNVCRNTNDILGLLSNSCNTEIDDGSVSNDLQKLEVVKDTITLESSSKKLFNVVYGKQTKKKHKTWEGDGTLEVGEKTITLKDVDGKILGTAMMSKNKVVDVGSRLYVGSKEVEIIDLIEITSRPASLVEAPKRVMNDTVGNDTKKKKIFSKFNTPLLNKNNSTDDLVLPEPSSEHQWNFNDNNDSLTQVSVCGFLSKKLRPHQKQGIIFLYECIMGFRGNFEGAILADEMGLGKTLQCIALIWTLIKQGPYGNKPVLDKVLIVAPSSLVNNWDNEFNKWLGKERILPFVVNPKNKVDDFINRKNHKVMIISYEMFVRSFEILQNINFSLLICDEAHRLKNSNIRAYQLLNQLLCSKRILLTGTPMQNDLQEFYTLVNFVYPGILGKPSVYKKQYEDPILLSRQPETEKDIRELGEEKTKELNQITSKFILRRTQDILDSYLPSKHEFVIFCTPTVVQSSLYKQAVECFDVGKENVFGVSDGSIHFELITLLKKICNHPALVLSASGSSDDHNDDGDMSQETVKTQLQKNLKNVTDVYSVVHSGKMTVLASFLRELKNKEKNKEKVVVVSYFTQTLDMLSDYCKQMDYIHCRLDGSTPVTQRAHIVDTFNNPNSNLFVFLLSAKAGGVGLNLIGASRLILYDSDWNPATDLQAMSRIWRDEQKRSVFIYRFLTTGTIEERIYQRQLNKQGLSSGVVETSTPFDSIKLSSSELKDIFSYYNSTDCLTHDMLNCECTRVGQLAEDASSVNHDEQRPCQLGQTHSNGGFRMNELLSWQHYGRPFDSNLLKQICLHNASDKISFIFKNSTL